MVFQDLGRPGPTCRQVSLVIIDEIHLLGGDRGPILEIIVSRMNYIAAQAEAGTIRLLGMSTAAANAPDLANWLGVKPGNNQGLFNFRHSVRPVPLEIYIDGFPEQRGFCPLMQSMNRPTYLAIKNHSPEKPVIVFVASRRQTRLTAKDLINYCGMEEESKKISSLRLGRGSKPNTVDCQGCRSQGSLVVRHWLASRRPSRVRSIAVRAALRSQQDPDLSRH